MVLNVPDDVVLNLFSILYLCVGITLVYPLS